MFKAEKVLWGEGLFLRPQHFQIQDTYHEQRLNHTVRAVVPFSYGVQKLSFDEAQLSTHILALESVEMIWQDGEIYQAPAYDLLPEPILLDELNLRGEMVIYLALPLLQANKQNLIDQNQSQKGRYQSHLVETHDLFTNATEADISLLRRRAVFKLLDANSNPDHNLDGFLYLPIGKIKRQSSGAFEIDRKFIPPILHVDASETLVSNLKRTLNGLNHFLQYPQIHPERLFFELLRLAGSLLTFSTAYEVDQLPAYKHHNLQESFTQLDTILRDLLDPIISSRYISIALKEIRPSYWVGSLETDKITRDTRLYIAVSSSAMQTHELIQIVPLRFKIGSTLDVEQRVVAALPAIPLHHLIQVPTAIPVRSGVSYFEIEPHHELYQRMLDSETICIYVPAGFQDISIELIAVMNA